MAVAAIALIGVSLPLAANAQTTPAADPSDVVIELDFSSSILQDKVNREKFADALDTIALRVDDSAQALMSGKASYTLVAFASEAVSYSASCTNLQLKASARHVTQLADCFRAVAAEYRRGLKAPIVAKVGTNTNYVAALQRANKVLPATSLRPAVVFFTDGKHDINGVPISDVAKTAQQLFGSRTPFAFLPVGMGLVPGERSRLEAGLTGLRDLTNGMKSCPASGGMVFEWNDVVFESAADAGQAVSVALQKVTCTFPTIGGDQTPTPAPTPTPPSPPDPPGAVVVTGQDGSITLHWTAPANSGTEPVLRYDVHCRPQDGEWLPTQIVEPPVTTASFTGLHNGTTYECQVRAVSAAGAGTWAGEQGGPAGPPEAPAGVIAEGRDEGALVAVQPGPDTGSPVTTYGFECAMSGTGSWVPVSATPAEAKYAVTGLTNELTYTCRAHAQNSLGMSPASPASNEFLACNGILQCNPWLVALLRVLIALLLIALILYFIQMWLNRPRRYVSAQIDGLAPVELGLGPDVGLVFLRDRRGRITDVMSGPPDSDIRVKYHGGGKFTATGSQEPLSFKDGEPGSITDPGGDTHQLILRAARRPQVDGMAYDETGQ